MRLRTLLIVAVMMIAAGSSGDAQRITTPRLYVIDGGVLESDPGRYRLSPSEVATTQLSVAAYLIVHPRGTLMWDSGAIQDGSWTPTGSPVVRRLVLSNSQDRQVTLRAPLMAQLAAAGVGPGKITYFALSHEHWDHVANANAFAPATWLVPQAQRDAMFPQTAEPPHPSTYAALRNSKAMIISGDHAVFGDGTVVIKPAPGHTPGHAVREAREDGRSGSVRGPIPLSRGADAEAAADR